jgi:hypothetical protein
VPYGKDDEQAHDDTNNTVLLSLGKILHPRKTVTCSRLWRAYNVYCLLMPASLLR